MKKWKESHTKPMEQRVLIKDGATEKVVDFLMEILLFWSDVQRCIYFSYNYSIFIVQFFFC